MSDFYQFDVHNALPAQIITMPRPNFDNTLPLSERVAQVMGYSRQLRAKVVAESGTKIRESYGSWLSDQNVYDIYRTLKGNEICKNCKGFPCDKSFHKRVTDVIEIDEETQDITIRGCACKYVYAEFKANQIKRLFKNASIPAQYKDLTFADYEVDEKNRLAVQAAHALLERTDKGVYFYGSYGTGKTMLASIIALEHLKKGRSVLFSKVPDLMRAVRATFNKKSEVTDVEVLKTVYEVPILILDDVRAVRGSNFESKTLFDIIDARYNAQLQTIITSNNTLSALRDALNNPTDAESCMDGDRIYDRCKEMCSPIKLEGKSRRRA